MASARTASAVVGARMAGQESAPVGRLPAEHANRGPVSRLSRRPVERQARAGVCRGLALLGLLLAVAGCRKADPYDYVRVSGDVLYEDGAPIGVADIQLFFYPQASPRDERMHPKIGWASIDPRTGKFMRATTRKVGDGLVAGTHKVTLNTISRGSLPGDVVGPEYGDPATTPLVVDTGSQPFRLRVARPPRETAAEKRP